jgi:hypothetical protein
MQMQELIYIKSAFCASELENWRQFSAKLHLLYWTIVAMGYYSNEQLQSCSMQTESNVLGSFHIISIGDSGWTLLDGPMVTPSAEANLKRFNVK